MTTDEQLAVCEKATPGPWVDTSTETEVGPIMGGDWREICHDPEYDDRQNDRAFICLAREGYPAALRRVAELEEAQECDTRLIEMQTAKLAAIEAKAREWAKQISYSERAGTGENISQVAGMEGK